MISQYVAQTPSSYGLPLLIEGLVESGTTGASEQRVVSANQKRRAHRASTVRVRSLASDLAGLGVERGDTVAIMDSESHQYSECFFAVQRIGTMLRTVNVRLLAEQFLYTINYAVWRGACLLPPGVRICRGHP